MTSVAHCMASRHKYPCHIGITLQHQSIVGSFVAFSAPPSSISLEASFLLYKNHIPPTK